MVSKSILFETTTSLVYFVDGTQLRNFVGKKGSSPSSFPTKRSIKTGILVLPNEYITETKGFVFGLFTYLFTSILRLSKHCFNVNVIDTLVLSIISF